MTGPLILGGSEAGSSTVLFQGMRVDDLSYTPPRSLLLDAVLKSPQSWMQEAMACERG